MQKQQAKIEKFAWDEIREEIAAVNPKLAAKIDQIDPSKDHAIYKVRYPFGSSILKDGDLCLPTPDGKVVLASDPRIDAKIREDLTYTPDIPIGMVLHNTCEIFWTLREPASVFRFMRPGRIFGLWVTMQEPGTSANIGKIWQITAGAKSLYMLPKISDANSYKKVKKEFNLQTPVPHNILGQWDSFCELANSPEFPDEWHAEVIFFSKSWLTSYNDPAWKELKFFMIETVWHDTTCARDQEAFSTALSIAQVEKNLKPNPYLADTVKHLYFLARGAWPGFKVAHDDIAAPVSALQQIFVDIYGLKFRPTMVYPDYMSEQNHLEPIYYSLEVPILMTSSPRSRRDPNKLNELREIKHIMQAIQAYIAEDKLGLKETPVYHLTQNIDYSFFHSNPDNSGDITSTKILTQFDSALLAEAEKYPTLPFCHTSPFLRGCIRISPRNT